MSNEHDITKAMLETIRLQGKQSINENEGDIINLEGQELKDEQTKFMEIVSPKVTFGAFKIYPNNNNAVFSGKFDNGIEWQFSKVDGLYVNMPNIEMNDEILELSNKLNAYFVNWEKEWSKKLNTEYKSNGEV